MRSARAVATDAAGNVSQPSNTNTFTIVAPAGAPVITSPADGSTTNDGTPTITGTAPPGSTVTVKEGGTVICTATADAAGAFSCTPMTALPDGPHTFTAVATVGGTDSPPSTPVTVTVDTTPPVVTITDGPMGTTTDPKGSFTVTSNEPNTRLECSIDGGPFMTCTSPVTTDLSPGMHSLEVRGTDPAGNTSTTRRDWTIAISGQYGGGGCSAAGLMPVGLFAVLVLLRRRRSARES
ncbi:MAG: hypothetical protein JNK82_42910 [Myxococcaceae bacterium]|nr:hypothetical protein [Myxococcaceae bacterium]